MHQICATFPGFHNKINTLTETVHKSSTATHLRNLVDNYGDGDFALLETLAVMVIIGLLVAITVTQIVKWRNRSSITSHKTDVRNVASAIEASYYLFANPLPQYVPAECVISSESVRSNDDPTFTLPWNEPTEL